MSGISNVSPAILAGGLGARLRSVVADRPKVLAQVGGQPFLAYLFQQLARAGFKEAMLLVGYGAEQVQAGFGDRYAGMSLRYSRESDPLGTAGALRLGLGQLERDTILLMNGDSYCDIDLHAFQSFHARRPDGVSIALARVENASRFGKVEIGPDDRVLQFHEKQSGGGAGWINAGLYLMPRAMVETIPAGQNVSLERDVVPRRVAEGVVQGFRCEGAFIDIGVPESYAAAGRFFAGLEAENSRLC